MKRIIITFTIVLATTFNAQTNSFPTPKIDFNPEKYICYRSDQLIKIDGNIYGTQWANVPWSDLFVDIEGDLKPKPLQETKMKMLWDDAYLYFAAELKEEHVWGKFTNRDAIIYYDNDFEVFIDPDNDTHNYYELELNALNTVWDLLLVKPYRDGHQVALTDWDIKGLKTAVQVQGSLNDASDLDSSWTIEIAIPWTTFREVSQASLPPAENDQWRVNFSRVQWEMEIDNGKYVKAKDPITNKNLSENNWVWSPQGIIAMHYPEMWGYVQFSYKVINYGEDEIIKNEEEEIRWFLRELYYKEKTHQLNHNKYTADLSKLGFTKIEIAKMKYKPFIQATSLRFNTSINNGEKIFTIYEDGRIFVKEIPEKR